MKQVRMSETTDAQLTAIKNARVNAGSFCKTKQDVIADLIAKAHKREVK